MRTFAICVMLMPLGVFAAEPAQVEVIVESFWMGGHEVTWGE